MAPSFSPRLASGFRLAGFAIVLLVLVTAPFERWYLTRRSNQMHERILDLRRSASARYPEGWQSDSAAVREVANLEYRRAHVRRRLLMQWSFRSGTVWLLLIGGALLMVGFIGRPSPPLRDSAPPPSRDTAPRRPP